MRSQHIAFAERSAVLNKIHEEAVRLVSSADAALVIIALAAIDQLSCYCFHSHGLSPPGVRLLPSVFVFGVAYPNKCVSCGNRQFCFLETSRFCLSRAFVPGGCS